MCGLGLGLKPGLGLGFGGLGLHKIVSQAQSQKMGLAGPGFGPSPGLHSCHSKFVFEAVGVLLEVILPSLGDTYP